MDVFLRSLKEAVLSQILKGAPLDEMSNPQVFNDVDVLCNIYNSGQLN